MIFLVVNLNWIHSLDYPVLSCIAQDNLAVLGIIISVEWLFSSCQNSEVGWGYGVTGRVHHCSFRVDKTWLQLVCCALVQEPGCLVISEGRSPECGTVERTKENRNTTIGWEVIARSAYIYFRPFIYITTVLRKPKKI